MHLFQSQASPYLLVIRINLCPVFSFKQLGYPKPHSVLWSAQLGTRRKVHSHLTILLAVRGLLCLAPFSHDILTIRSGWDGFAPASDAPSDRPAFGGTCFTNIFNVPIQITSYDDSAIKASSIFTATNSNDQAFAYPYEGFALGVAVLAGTTGSSQSTATSISNSLPFDDTGTSTGGMKPGAVAGLVIGCITAVFLLVAVVIFALNHRHKRLTDRRSQFQFYNSHILLNDSPTQMIYMDGSGKGVDVGAVTRPADEHKFYQELEGSRRKTVYEMEAGPLPVTRTKQLPDLPPRTE
jgi:hypothetical protein